MLSALRLVRHPAVVLASPLPPKVSAFSSSSAVGAAGRPTSSPARSFCAAAAEPRRGAAMEGERPKQEEVTTDPMAASFGVGYATRSEEEGFGGIYGRNQTLPAREGEDDVADGEVRRGYEESHGSGVKEKEKGRNETETTTAA